MDMLKKFFPFAFMTKENITALVIQIIVHIVLGAIIGAIIGLLALIPILGILIGLLGGVLACLAYPLYHIIIKRERKKIAPEILRLSDELIQ